MVKLLDILLWNLYFWSEFSIRWSKIENFVDFTSKLSKNLSVFLLRLFCCSFLLTGIPLNHYTCCRPVSSLLLRSSSSFSTIIEFFFSLPLELIAYDFNHIVFDSNNLVSFKLFVEPCVHQPVSAVKINFKIK